MFLSWISHIHKVLLKRSFEEKFSLQNFLEQHPWLFIKTAPPQYNTSQLSTSQVHITFHHHFLFENVDTIPMLHGLSTVLDRGHGYSNSFNSTEG